MPLQSDISVSSGAFSGLPLGDALLCIAELAPAAEITSYGRHSLLHIDNARAVAALGLPFSVHGPFVGVELGSGREAKRRAAVDLHRRHLKVAAALGASLYVVHPDRLLAPRPHHAAVARALQRSFAELYALQVAFNVPIAVENMPFPEISHFTSPGELDLQGLGLALDAGHAALAGNLSAWLADPRAELLHVHLHDTAGRRHGDEHRPLGTGVVDVAAVVAVARAAGAAMVFEHTNERDVITSIEYLRRLDLLAEDGAAAAPRVAAATESVDVRPWGESW